MIAKPKYPIYVPSKGRADMTPRNATVSYFIQDKVPFHVVVEPQEQEAYEAAYGKEHVLVLPFSNLGQGSIPARNWIKDHAASVGAERHWCIDDNIWGFVRCYKGRRIPCNSGVALRVVEDFCDRYENVAIAGLNYRFFGGTPNLPPFFLNVHVYSCMLIRTDLEYRWRGRYNEDTDLCLQALAGGWCTVLVNAFLCNKQTTLTMKGGNMTDLYQGDGRLKMARSLEREWPLVVETRRRFNRPQHYIRDQWGKFDTQLKPKPGFDKHALKQVDEYGLDLKQVVSEVKSDELKQMLVDWQKKAE